MGWRLLTGEIVEVRAVRPADAAEAFEIEQLGQPVDRIRIGPVARRRRPMRGGRDMDAPGCGNLTSSRMRWRRGTTGVTPGICVQHVVRGARYEKRIERLVLQDG